MLRRLSYGLLVFLLLCSSSPCYAYTITETELTELEGNMTKLQQITDESEKELQNLKTALVKSDNQLTQLNNQLNELRYINQTQAESLVKANQYLNEYAKEQKAKQHRLKTERNVAILVAIVSLIAAIK